MGIVPPSPKVLSNRAFCIISEIAVLQRPRPSLVKYCAFRKRAWVSSTPRGRTGPCCLQPREQPQHPGTHGFRRSIAPPTCPATDASPAASRRPAYGSRRELAGSALLPEDFHVLPSTQSAWRSLFAMLTPFNLGEVHLNLLSENPGPPHLQLGINEVTFYRWRKEMASKVSSVRSAVLRSCVPCRVARSLGGSTPTPASLGVPIALEQA